MAVRVFADPFAFSKLECIENGEQRWQTIGLVDGVLVLLVAHTTIEKNNEEVVRIISARKAEAKERKSYEQNRSL